VETTVSKKEKKKKKKEKKKKYIYSEKQTPAVALRVNPRETTE
jgi:hypothetical protein